MSTLNRYGLILWLTVACLLIGTQAYAGAFVCVPKNVTDLPCPGCLNPPALLHKHMSPDECAGYATFDPSQKLAKVRAGDTIVVFFQDDDNNQKTLAEAGLTSVSVTIGATTQPFTLASGTGGDGSWYLFRITLSSTLFPNASHGDLVKVQIYAKNVPNTIWNLGFVAPVSLYGIGNSHIGVWFPVALFSTNFQSNATGVTLAPMPVGLAWGAKWNATNGFYLGGSIIGNWLISPAKDSKGVATGNYNAAGITAGALVDVNNWIYVGYAYGFDLTSAHQNPGNLCVLGVAPGLLQLLQSKP